MGKIASYIISVSILVLLMTSCATRPELTAPEPPGWYFNPHKDDSYAYYDKATASSYSEQDSLDAAYNRAVTSMVKRIRSKVSSVSDNDGTRLEIGSQMTLEGVEKVAEESARFKNKWFSWVLIKYSREKHRKIKEKIGKSEEKAKKLLIRARAAKEKRHFVKAKKYYEEIMNTPYVARNMIALSSGELLDLPDPVPPKDYFAEKLSGKKLAILCVNNNSNSNFKYAPNLNKRMESFHIDSFLLDNQSSKINVSELCHLASEKDASYLMIMKINVIDAVKSNQTDVFLTTQWKFYSISGKMLGSGYIKTKWPKKESAVKLASITAMNVFVIQKSKNHIHWD